MGPQERPLCRVAELPDGGARELLSEGFDDRVLAVGQGSDVVLWLNDRPHEHRPLGWKRHAFPSADGSHIVCRAHSADFDIRSGESFTGPCKGAWLLPLPITMRASAVWTTGALPDPFD